MAASGDTWTIRRARWRRYRVGRTLLFCGVGLYLPAMVAAHFALQGFGWSDEAMMWIAATWMVACTANVLWLIRFICPNCSRRFFAPGNGWVARPNAWASKCCHCGARPPA